MIYIYYFTCILIGLMYYYTQKFFENEDVKEIPKKAYKALITIVPLLILSLFFTFDSLMNYKGFISLFISSLVTTYFMSLLLFLTISIKKAKTH